MPEQQRSPCLPLRCCLLSGGESRRMGQDKALLPHPQGGTWLEHSLMRLAQLGAPVTLLSRHRQHLALAEALASPLITASAEPPPWEGPLLALARLMQNHPDQRLLLCPVDMPDLSLASLQQLLAVAATEPVAIHLAHDGRRLQPLLGLYPGDLERRTSLAACLDQGERRLQSWLATQPCRPVLLPAAALRNVNRAADLNPAAIA